METVITLIVVGAVLLFLETVLPGMIAGMIGVACISVGVVMAYVRFGVPTGHWVLGGVAAGLILGTLAWLRYFPNSRLARRFVSHTTVGELGTERPELLNQTGTTLTRLRPSGTALINGRRVDVVSDGNFLDAGQPIKVIAVEGLRVVVRPQ